MPFFTRFLERMSLNASLGRVLPLELEVISAYDRTIGRISIPGTADQLAQFRNEHAQHLEDLFRGVASLARMFPVSLREKLRTKHPGYQGPIATDGTEEALRQILRAEHRAQLAWGRVRTKMPAEVSQLVRRFAEDEERHLRFLEKMVATKVWEQAAEPQIGA